MFAFRAAALAAALAFAAPAPAMTIADLANGRMFVTAPVDLGLAGELLAGQPSRVDRLGAETAHARAQRYFDFDALITLGALALSGGAFAALAAMAMRRRAANESAEPAWRESVFREIQEDLARFANVYRRAA